MSRVAFLVSRIEARVSSDTRHAAAPKCVRTSPRYCHGRGMGETMLMMKLWRELKYRLETRSSHLCGEAASWLACSDRMGVTSSSSSMLLHRIGLSLRVNRRALSIFITTALDRRSLHSTRDSETARR